MEKTPPCNADTIADAVNKISFDQSILDLPHLHALVLATRIAVNRKTHCLSREEIGLLNDCLLAQHTPNLHALDECKHAPEFYAPLRLAYAGGIPVLTRILR